MSPAVQTLLEQGREQRYAGEYARASASLERALRIESGEPKVWLEMGRLRYDEGNFAQAEQMGRKALSLAPAGSAVGAQASRLIDDAQFGQGG
jgi:Flp pilus assembly protein TadD